MQSPHVENTRSRSVSIDQPAGIPPGAHVAVVPHRAQATVAFVLERLGAMREA